MHGSTLIFHSSSPNRLYPLTQEYGGAYSAFGAAAQERFSPMIHIRNFHHAFLSLAGSQRLLFPS